MSARKTGRALIWTLTAFTLAGMPGCRSEPKKAPQAAPSAAAVASSAVAPSHDAAAFIAWVARWRADPTKLKDDSLECFGPSDPESGWCDALIATDEKTWSLRYRKDRPAAARFEDRTVPKGASLTCASLDGETKGEAYERGAQIRQRCTIGKGTLAGLDALLTTAPLGGTISVYSPEYIEANPDFGEK